MKKAIKDWFWTFLAGFLATVLGIALTFGIQNRVNAKRRAETARLLAVRIVDNMGFTHKELLDYQRVYTIIDSCGQILHHAIQADTLDRVNDTTITRFLNGILTEYVQVNIDNGLDAYKTEILDNIGDIELISHIERFYAYAREYTSTSGQVIEQKRLVTDKVYSHFYGKDEAGLRDFVLYLHNLPECDLFFARLQNINPLLVIIDQVMKGELDACRQRLGMQH